ncbi:hypothetical protein [Maridesulfovibrio zosterae]|uniref:hypothetical protein n=1 Tax=Maridesulfovibrio zosterae TaxID=82171 RepID=UPI0003F87F78|nr:hypothetical protein [Maridesulfovibrio zosterae]
MLFDQVGSRSILFSIFMCILLTVVTSSLVHARSLFGSPDSLEESGAELAKILSEYGVLDGKRIAVLEFESIGENGPSMLDKRIAVHIATRLAVIKKRTWTVVERFDLARMQNELSEHKDTSFDYNTWMRKSLKADLLVLGSYVLSKEKLHITAKVVNPESGSTLASASVNQYLDDETSQLARTRKPATNFAKVADDIKSILIGSKGSMETTGGSRVKLFKLVDGKRINFKRGELPVYKIGDKMGFSIKPPITSRLYVFNYDPAAEHGEAILLYPIPDMEPYDFLAQRTRFFPSFVSHGVRAYDVQEPRGRMVFKIIGVESTVEMDLTRSFKFRDGEYWLDSTNLTDFIEDLSTLPDASWWSEDVEFWIQ